MIVKIIEQVSNFCDFFMFHVFAWIIGIVFLAFFIIGTIGMALGINLGIKDK